MGESIFSLKKNLFFFLTLLLIGFLGIASGTPLDDYVAMQDGYYSWQLIDRVEGKNSTLYLLFLNSQKWRTESELDQPLWTHWLTIAVPHTINSKTALFYINGGRRENTSEIFSGCLVDRLADVAGSVICELSMVPNQCIKFPDEFDPRYVEKGRQEDALIAYTWDKFFQTGDPFWSIRLPMTKAVVRAMDAVDDFCTLISGESVEGYILIGASKRGWTAWTTAAVDNRVRGIIPIVFDALNFNQCLINHYKAYGGWSSAVHDYIDMQITEKTNTPEFKALMAFEEPYAYLDRFTMPKFVINSAGDEFFLPDSSATYFHDLPGEKYLRYIPNTNHYLQDSDCLYSVVSFAKGLLEKKKFPQFTWEKRRNETLCVKTLDKPMKVILWKAKNTRARDFRFSMIGNAWESDYLFESDEEEGCYIVKLKKPKEGWAAYFIELTFDSGLFFFPYKFTTDVFVVPDLFPYTYPE